MASFIHFSSWVRADADSNIAGSTPSFGNGAGANRWRAAMLAVAVLGLPFTMHAQGAPALTVSTGSVSFGNAALWLATTKKVTLTSSGTAPLTISAGTLKGPPAYSMSGVSFPITLNPGQTATLAIRFYPGATGVKIGTVTLTSNASPNTTEIALSGTSVGAGLTVSTSSVAFGNVPVNTTVTQEVTLTSTGTVELEVKKAMTVTGAGYSVPDPKILLLEPGQTATLAIQFDPTTAGASTGTIALQVNTSSETVSIAVSGTGTGPASGVELNWAAPTTTVDPPSGYNVYRAVNGSTTYQMLNSSLVPATTYDDTTAASGTSYNYYVVSMDSAGEASGPSNVFNVVVP